MALSYRQKFFCQNRQDKNHISVKSGRKNLIPTGMAYLYLPVFIFLLSMACSCQSDDRLTPAKPLLPGDMLISHGGVFALGFFSLTNSSSSSYVGIWYNNIPERTYVWIANRDNPITTDVPGTKLAFTNSSDLVLLDSTGHTIWMTRSSISAGGGGTAAVVLLDSGNLVIQSIDGTAIWESFDHLTDTVIPGVSLSLSSSDAAASARRLVAWKGPDDPSSGNFSMGGDSSSDLQIVTWNGTRPFWRRAAWGGEVTFGTFEDNTSFTMYETITGGTGDDYYIKLTVSDGAPIIRVSLDYTGLFTYRRWNLKTSSWTVFVQFPSSACDRYAFCGPFAYCDSTETVPSCKCLDGFEPIGLDFSQGCRRKEELKCGDGDTFLTLPTMKTPDKFLYIKNRSFDQCTAECSNNCSCTAYAYDNLQNVDSTIDTTRCLVWMGELIDAEKFGNTFGENLYLRVSSSPGKHQTGNVQNNLLCLNPPNEFGNENLDFPSFSFEDIIIATNNFSDYKLLGEGGFGKVYKGVLEGGKEVAVKRLSKGSVQGIQEFRNEVVLIAKLQHRNLVRLLGFCIHEDEKLLIYEYLPNKSLDAFLFGMF
ncbi:G-type lectin S-receptor-like serine/threonine-protein kinase B120 [Zea mays]|uniref:non-specific serine/threonine protein kinase n=1 Tax=Zea mays TaxID=4577 RepID=A0A1D6DXI2_MAIZE|nr:G-type lectin S-receptor-like serine/threonine-protein kinase B120 [Zea mays]